MGETPRYSGNKGKVISRANRKKITWFRPRLSSWYQSHGRDFQWRRKRASTAYKVIITEILLQRTKAETVAKVYDGFMQRYPSWNTLAQATREELQEVVVTLGLWRRRVDTLLTLARTVAERGEIQPLDRETLESLPGVGQYIANAVLSICQDQREPMLDVNMARVLERFFGPRQMADIRYDPYLQELSRAVLPKGNSKEMNWAILDLGALACTKRHPRCKECPLSGKCLFVHSSVEKDDTEGNPIQGNNQETG